MASISVANSPQPDARPAAKGDGPHGPGPLDNPPGWDEAAQPAAGVGARVAAAGGCGVGLEQIKFQHGRILILGEIYILRRFTLQFSLLLESSEGLYVRYCGSRSHRVQ